MNIRQDSFIILKVLFVVLCFTFSSFAFSENVKQVEVESEGYGPSLHSAVNNAIIDAISQVHGKSIESERVSESMEVSATTQNDEAYLASDGYMETIKEKTKGAVSSYQILSQQQTGTGNWRVQLAVKVADYKRSKSSERMRLAILPLQVKSDNYIVKGKKVPSSIAQEIISQQLSNYLVQSRKFAILDRDYEDQANQELAKAKSDNASIDEIARLGQRLVADYIVVGSIEELYYSTQSKSMRTSDKTYMVGSGALSISYKIIDVATQQVVFSDSDEVTVTHNDIEQLQGSAEHAAVMAMSSKLAKKLTFSIQNQIFPLAILSRNGASVLISQGGKTLKVGDKYNVYKKGEKLYDPYTKEFLGRDEQFCCVVAITRVTPKISYANVISDIGKLPNDIPQKTFILREVVTHKEKTKPKVKNLIKKSVEKDEDW